MLFIGSKQDANNILAGIEPQPQLKIISMEAALQTPLNRCWDVGVVYHALTLSHWPATQALLSRLRDVNCRAVYLCWRHDAEKGSAAELQEKLRALAYTFLGFYGHDGLAYFDIHDYKHVPEWLNARDWARPELWNKFRW